MSLSLGRLQCVDLREVWENEASKFTPWLAQEDSLVLLGDTIGIDLELEATEKDVGPFRADILCKDTGTNSWVLIENQLGRTDHCHLGQILTYAAGLNAVTIVWIAAPFTDEHRATLDWLNDITEDQIRFFGLEIEAWQIGDSLPAPKFNIVSKPNDWSRSVTKAASGISQNALTETKKLQLKYWTAFSVRLQENSKRIKPTKPQPQHWMTYAIGRSDFYLVTTANTRDNRIAAFLQIGGNHAKSYFHLLHERRVEIEQKMGETLDWRKLPDKKESHVYLSKEDTDPMNESRWEEQHLWLVEKLEKLNEVFRPIVRTLNADDWAERLGEGGAE